ncbi:hypothetical protein GOV09_07090 [Candidatus Woesearchaeota archaeon]|nr:hypothetical protein [Candidatus Woesearchaeota archaeon]
MNLLDKSDGVETHYLPFAKGFTLQIWDDKSEQIIIQAWSLHEATSKDKRPALMGVSHIFADKSENAITLCVDMKNHTPNQPLHLNIDWKSEETSDELFKKIFIGNYPNGLNHMPLSTNKGIGGGPIYKIVDLDKVIQDILLFLKEKKLFELFPEKDVSCIDSTDIDACKERISSILDS